VAYDVLGDKEKRKEYDEVVVSDRPPLASVPRWSRWCGRGGFKLPDG